MSCLQEALDGGHPKIDRRIYRLRMSVKMFEFYLHYIVIKGLKSQKKKKEKKTNSGI